MQQHFVAVIKQRVPNMKTSQLAKSTQVQRALLGVALIASDDKWNEEVLSAVDKVWSNGRDLEAKCE